MSDATIAEMLKEQSATLEDAITLLEIAVDDHDCHFGAVIEPTTHWSFQAKLFLAKRANSKTDEAAWLADLKAKAWAWETEDTRMAEQAANK